METRKWALCERKSIRLYPHAILVSDRAQEQSLSYRFPCTNPDQPGGQMNHAMSQPLGTRRTISCIESGAQKATRIPCGRKIDNSVFTRRRSRELKLVCLEFVGRPILWCKNAHRFILQIKLVSFLLPICGSASKCARQVMSEWSDVVMAFGQSDEFSFLLPASSPLYGRRSAKISTSFASLFSSRYVRVADQKRFVGRWCELVRRAIIVPGVTGSPAHCHSGRGRDFDFATKLCYE